MPSSVISSHFISFCLLELFSSAASLEGQVYFSHLNTVFLAPFEQMSDEMRDFHIDVNIKGVWNTCQAVIPYMLKQGKGSIVIASSVTGDIVADAGEAAYAMTKAALVGLTKCLAVEYASRHIRVNCSQLGYARTPMVEKMAVESNPDDPESAIADIAKGVPMVKIKRLSAVQDIARMRFNIKNGDEEEIDKLALKLDRAIMQLGSIYED